MTNTELTSTQLYIRLLRYVQPYWRVFLVSILSMAVAAATEPAFAKLLKPMLDDGFVNKDMRTIQVMPWLIVGIFLIRSAASYISDYTIAWVGNKMVMDLRNDMFKKLLSLPTQFFDHNSTGTLISKITFDVSQVTSAATNVVTVAIQDTLVIIGLLGLMFYENWRLTLVALVMGPLMAILVRIVSGRLRRMSREVQRWMGLVTHTTEESIACHRVVKIFGGQEYEKKRFSYHVNQLRQFNMKQSAAAAAGVPVIQILASIALAVIVYYGALQSLAGELTPGGFFEFMAAMLMLITPLKRLTGVNASLQRGLAAAESIFGLMDQQPEPDTGHAVIARAKGNLTLDHVSFSYAGSNRPALNGVSLDVAPGETIALVGSSGSGKTTFANLIPRFYHPTSGKILLDGLDIETLQLQSLREQIALVSQDVVLFNDTVAANIAYGMMNGASETMIEAAATAAHAMDFIREMPQGLQTMIGENGLRLSGGQRQRLAIARALLKDAPLLILDEATSALDSESERHVQAALETLMKGRTTIVIAHRLSTIENADRIVVLDKGAITEVGTHRELLAHEGIYANLYRIQYAQEKQNHE